MLLEKIDFVQHHRKSLERTAGNAVAKARAAYVERVDEAERARQELIEASETQLWAALFPSEHLTSYPATHSVAAGLRKPVEHCVPGLTWQVPANALFALLRDEADLLADAHTLPQAVALQGVNEATLKEDSAVWADSEEDRERQARDQQRAVESYARDWGHKPPEFG